MAMGECSAYSSLQADSKVKFALAYELAATWRWPTSAWRNHIELSHMAGAVDDSTIDIVMVIIIIIIIIIITSPGAVVVNCGPPCQRLRTSSIVSIANSPESSARRMSARTFKTVVCLEWWAW